MPTEAGGSRQPVGRGLRNIVTSPQFGVGLEFKTVVHFNHHDIGASPRQRRERLDQLFCAGLAVQPQMYAAPGGRRGRLVAGSGATGRHQQEDESDEGADAKAAWFRWRHEGQVNSALTSCKLLRMKTPCFRVRLPGVVTKTQ